MNEDTFYEEFKPQINHIARAKQPETVQDEDICAFGGVLYTTYGKEMDYVWSLRETQPNHIWTVIESDDDFFIIAGLHFVNRFGFMITEKAWTNKDEEIKLE